MSVFRILRADTALLVATVLLSLLGLSALWVTPYPPLHDLPDHVGLALQMWPTLTGSAVQSTHYDVQFVPVPYLTTYLFIALLGPLLGAALAAKALVGLSMLLLPLGLMRLLVALRRSPRFGLLGFALSVDHNMAWGFVAFHLGLGLALLVVAKLLEGDDGRQIRKAWPLAVLLALTHAHAFGVAVLFAAVLALSRGQFWPRLKAHAIAFVPAVLALVPWLVSRIMSPRGETAKVTKLADWHALQHKVTHLFAYTLDVVPRERNLTSLGLFLLGVCVVLALRLPDPQPRREDRGALAAFALAAALYIALPMGIFRPIEQWYIYPRHATVLLLAALLVPRPRLDGRAGLFALAMLCVTAALPQLAVTRAWAGFGKRAKDFAPIVQALPENTRLLTLTLDDGDPEVPLGPYNQFHAWAIAEKGGYDPYLFDNPSHPIVHRAENALPHPAWNRMGAFSHPKHGAFFDHVLVQGKNRDPYRKRWQSHVEKVAESGRWRLYRVKKVRSKGR